MLKNILCLAAGLTVVGACKNDSGSQATLMEENGSLSSGHQASPAGQSSQSAEVAATQPESTPRSVDEQIRYIYRNVDAVTASFFDNLQGLAMGTAQTGRQGLAYGIQNRLISKEYASYLLNEKLRPLYEFGKVRGFKKTVMKAVLKGKLKGLCEQYARDNQMAL